jgi:hypothetical protein
MSIKAQSSKLSRIFPFVGAVAAWLGVPFFALAFLTGGSPEVCIGKDCSAPTFPLPSVYLILFLVALVLAFWATKRDLDRRNARAAKAPIYASIGATILLLPAFWIVLEAFPGFSRAVVASTLACIVMVIFTWLSVAITRVGIREGSGLWRVTGIVGVIGNGAIAAGMALAAVGSIVKLSQSSDADILVSIGLIAAIIGVAVNGITLICHGLALLKSATGEPAPASGAMQ